MLFKTLVASLLLLLISFVSAQDVRASHSKSKPSFAHPNGVAKDPQGNVYIADYENHCIRKISPNGQVTTLAGSGKLGSRDGKGTAASFAYPAAVAVDAQGNVYVADQMNNKIRKITPDGTVSTIAGDGKLRYMDGQGTSSCFANPSGIAVDTMGNVYVADTLNNRIRKIDSNGQVTTVAGDGRLGSMDGQGTQSCFSHPTGIAVDSKCTLYITEPSANKIRKVTVDGAVTTLAGDGRLGSMDGQGTTSCFANPTGIAVDAQCNVYVSEEAGNKIRKIDPAGAVTTIAGDGRLGSMDGQGTSSCFAHPAGLAVDAQCNLYVAETGGHKIRKITAAGAVSTIAGTGSYGSQNGRGNRP